MSNGRQETIKVTSEYLKAQREELSVTLHMVEQHFFEATHTMGQLDSCFSTQVAKQLFQSVNRQQESGKKAFQRLRNQIEKLSAIADVYAQTEESNTNAG